MNYFRFFRFGWHRSLNVGSRLKKVVYFVLGDPATPTQIRILPFLLWLKNRKVSNALDIGISHGSLIYYLADEYRNANVYGIDVVDEFIEESMKIKFRCGEVYANVTIMKCDIQKPLTFGATFDLVTMFDVLEHIKDYDACLKNISEKMGGGSSLSEHLITRMAEFQCKRKRGHCTSSTLIMSGKAFLPNLSRRYSPGMGL